MMGQKTAQPKLYYSFSLDQAVPSTHLVRRLTAAVDFSFVYGLVRRYYSRTGQPSVDPVVLFKLSLLGYLFNITSERRLCEEASLNLAWRWFLGYELDEAIPDHSVLSKARRRFGPVVYERFFRRIVELCEARGLVQGDVLFLDSTLTTADASKESLRSRALFQQLEPPKRFVAELWQANEETETTEPQPAREPKPRPDRGVVNERAVSATDPDAELVSQRGKPAMLAHKVHMVVDGGRARIVTAVVVRPASETDSHAVEHLLDKHATAVEQPARELVADSGYTSEPALKACEKRGLLPTLAKRSTSNRHGGWDRDRFTFVPERDVFICPAGHEMRHSNENLRFRQSVYRTVKGTCHRCPLKASCSPGRAERSVTRRWDAGLWEEFELHVSSRRARRHLRRRKVVVEPIIGDSKVKHGLDRACFRGREKMLIQALLTASVLNIKQLVRRVPVLQTGSAALAASPPTSITACPRLRSSAHLRRYRSARRCYACQHEADSPTRR
jgi:transposase